MRLVNAKYGIDLSLDESRPEILVFENRRIMREITEELWKQCSGLEGSFVMSDNKVLKIEKNVEIMINPFNLDFQSRKIMNALYTKMSAAANEQVEEKYRINADIINMLDMISSSVNYSGITYQLDFPWTELFKMYGVKIDVPDDFIARIIEYMKIVSELCGISVFCFVNLKSYLNYEEIMALYKNAEYNKIKLILIEPNETKIIDSEHVTIIDRDLCLIERI